ncbi:hypothetical protein [Kibdelosporangium phytohabitans]|uniref:Uncharacterized protein n=1 Tax=Kibdelosporangium phytohabitans TaxID=860235 RepID=A0A0N9HN87_9PSEU|nr:hypothetical protein [Kibdelosporangium phytohabitans]ALG08382.1 hypothetical protein AOZ06_17015 [Kibdelosporangium phytohabitans]MBE1470570.1 hypothetical protein [Kibdelosporangium phytohabitans]
MTNALEPSPEEADGDALYLEKTLRHTPTDLLLDESSGRNDVRAVWRSSSRLAIGTFLLFTVIWIINGGLIGTTSRSSSDDEDVLLIMGIVFGVIAFIVRWALFLGSEKQEAISEWSTLLAGRAAAADSVYSHIVGRLREREFPIRSFAGRRHNTLGVTGNRLVLVEGHHYVYVSVFRYGTSLYLGWTMWRVRKGSTLLTQNFYGSSQGTGPDPIGRILNLEQLKAMREAVHSICREALHTAVQNVNVPEDYGFPSGMPPIENLPYGTAPQPGGVQAGAQQPPLQ